MKIKILSLVVMALLLLVGITCKEAITPFSPQTDIENQSESSRTSSQNASTENQVKDIKYINEYNKKLDASQKSWADSRTASHSASFDHNYGYNPKNPLFKPFQTKTISTQKASTQFKESSHHNDFTDTEKGNKKPRQQALNVQIHPDKWNVNWAQSQGLLTVRISGEGYEDIDPESLRLSISGGGESISPWMAGVKGSSLVAKFLKKEAIGLISSPKAGQTYDIQVAGNYSGEEAMSFGPLTDAIVIVGKNSEQEENEEDGDEVNLSLEVKPDEWNLSWASTADNDDDNGEGGIVTAILSGEDAGSIVAGSIRMALGSCEEDGQGISPESEDLEGDEYKARFSRSEALGLIPDPQAGQSYTIHVSGQLEGGQPFCLEYTVTVVSDEEDDEGDEANLHLKIKPDEWSLSWASTADNDDDNGEGEIVTAIIEGEGFDSIIEGSLKMGLGSCDGADSSSEISPVSEGVDDDEYKARFSRSEALGLIPDPQAGESYTIHVRGQLDGDQPFCLEYSVTIVSDEEGDEGDEANLHLKIKPDKWNLSWADTSGSVADNDEGDDEDDNDSEDDEGVVIAFIKGQGFADIDPTTVSMSCTDPGELDEISPAEYEFGGKFFKAKFPQNQAIKLINNPQEDKKYEIVVSGQLKGGTPFSLSYEITIHGKKKGDDDDDDI